ncbi:MAG: UDP-N-acetylmuramoyl-tripeptide--D-alanyl-D-alanine ligase [Firmicutes bacterium]|nr:UDP-N-acetylmuramoyl-tripeptide--D-alanyl-D-alanine ligase [Bacillota bacterium]
MRPTSLDFLASAANARILGNASRNVFDVKIDSREAAAGCLFVCVIGDINDGHDYIHGAYDNGCRIFLMSREEKAEELLARDPDVSILLAADTQIAFRDMAKAYLGQFDVKKLAITGSVGKTSTRTYTAAIIGSRYDTQSSKKNLNTHLGLCITCFQADEHTQVMVFEMGMDRSGEIAEYVDWIRPDTAVITNVGISHLERLGSRDAIADAKLEIVKYFGPDNLLIYNADSDYLNEEEITKRTGGNFRMYSVGTSEDCKMQLLRVNAEGAAGIRFTLKANDIALDYAMPVLGAHNAIDAALAVAAGLSLGVPMTQAAKALSEVKPNPRRMNAVRLGGITVIDDTYNASPESMKAALDVLDQLRAERKIAILADMLELGEMEEKGHLEVGRRVANSSVDVLFAIGRRAKAYADCAAVNENIKIFYAEDLAELEPVIRRTLLTGDTVLIKGSNITGVAGLAQRIRDKLSWEDQ